MQKKSGRQAFSFVEIIVALTIGVGCFTGLIWFASTTRVETSKAGNYLRALQIAQETIELIQSTPQAELTPTKIQIFEGSLVNSHTKNSVKIPVHSASAWQPATKNYPEQYNNAWFYRKVRMEQISGGGSARFLRKISVDVYWNEGKAPDKIDSLDGEPDRMRKLSLATLIFDESEYY